MSSFPSTLTSGASNGGGGGPDTSRTAVTVTAGNLSTITYDGNTDVTIQGEVFIKGIVVLEAGSTLTLDTGAILHPFANNYDVGFQTEVDSSGRRWGLYLEGTRSKPIQVSGPGQFTKGLDTLNRWGALRCRYANFNGVSTPSTGANGSGCYINTGFGSDDFWDISFSYCTFSSDTGIMHFIDLAGYNAANGKAYVPFVKCIFEEDATKTKDIIIEGNPPQINVVIDGSTLLNGFNSPNGVNIIGTNSAFVSSDTTLLTKAATLTECILAYTGSASGAFTLATLGSNSQITAKDCLIYGGVHNIDVDSNADCIFEGNVLVGIAGYTNEHIVGFGDNCVVRFNLGLGEVNEGHILDFATGATGIVVDYNTFLSKTPQGIVLNHLGTSGINYKSISYNLFNTQTNVLKDEYVTYSGVAATVDTITNNYAWDFVNNVAPVKASGADATLTSKASSGIDTSSAFEVMDVDFNVVLAMLDRGEEAGSIVKGLKQSAVQKLSSIGFGSGIFGKEEV